MGRYIKKDVRSKWSENDMVEAVTAVKNGTKLNTAAKSYNVPRNTLRRYLLKSKVTKSQLGRPTLLKEAQERDLVKRIKKLASVGYPLTPKCVRNSVVEFCKANNIPMRGDTCNKKYVSKDWLKSFRERHPEISVRKPQNLNPARAQKLNKFVVDDYFKKLKQVMLKLNVMNKPELIYNIDEKGCRLTLHNTPKVLAPKGVKRVHIVAPEHAENITIVACGNALGNVIPPMVLFKGKRMKSEWKDDLPSGSAVLMTPKGSMNIETFNKWLEHFARYKLPGNCLLIFDGAKCHIDISIVETAEKHNITLFCLPSNTTHELQPMDKAVFRSFEYHWDAEVLKYWSKNNDRSLTKQRFGRLFSAVWDKALTPANIKSGFEATGIFPYDPDKIPEEAFGPSLPSHTDAPQEETHATQEVPQVPQDRPQTPEESQMPQDRFQTPQEEPQVPQDRRQTPEKSQLPQDRPQTPQEEPQVPQDRRQTPEKSQLPQDRPQTPQEEPQVPQDRTQTPEDEPQAPQDRPQSLQDDTQVPQDRPQTPEESQLPQDRPQTPQEEPQVPQGRLQTPEDEPQAPQDRPQTLQDEPQVPQDRPQTPQVSQEEHRDSQEMPQESDSSDDDIPLASLQRREEKENQLVNISFSDLMKTPVKSSTNKVIRKKAVNSLALELNTYAVELHKINKNKTKKSLAESTKKTKTQKNQIPKKRVPQKMEINKKTCGASTKVTKNVQQQSQKRKVTQKKAVLNVSWYCFLCREDRIADMRKCDKCKRYVHEDCVGLTSEDQDSFICPRCED